MATLQRDIELPSFPQIDTYRCEQCGWSFHLGKGEYRDTYHLYELMEGMYESFGKILEEQRKKINYLMELHNLVEIPE